MAIVGTTDNPVNGNVVIGNRIGTTVDGTDALGNSTGVSITNGELNTIGGIVATTREGQIDNPPNVISGNDGPGILIEGTKSSENKVYGNFIGTDKSGYTKLKNGQSGIVLSGGATSNYIGGPQAGARNVISGNFGDGVRVEKPCTKNWIEGNSIGVGPDKAKNNAFGLENWEAGINFLVGDEPAQGNFVKSNVIYAKDSKDVVNKEGNKILDPNFITYDGSGYGIDNGSMEGVPVIDSATVSNNQITITGSLTHTPNSTFILEFFGNQVDRRQATSSSATPPSPPTSTAMPPST